MGMKLDSKTGVYHYTTDGGFHIALVAEGAMDTACKLKDDRIKELEGKLKLAIEQDYCTMCGKHLDGYTPPKEK